MTADPIAQAAQAGGVNIFGAGRFARDVAQALQQQGVRVHAFLISAPPSQPALDDVPLRQLDATVLAGVPLWVGVFNREAHSDYAALQRMLLARYPAARIVWPQCFYAALLPTLGFRFWLHPVAAYAANAAAIAQARALLDDEASRQVFDQVLAFRRDAAAHGRPPQPLADAQYLPDWLRDEWLVQQRGGLRLVDGGAYRGETLRALGTRLPVEQAWTFEPDADNHAALVEALAGWPGPATHIPAGLGAGSGVAAFTRGQGEASRFSQSGSQHVPIVALDECLHRASVNFIKLDVEGHELAALAGARATLQRQRPTLAIAAYHRWDDLWQLPVFLAQTGLKYRLRLGLHGHNSFDTVLYAF